MLDPCTILVQADSTLISGAKLLQMDAEGTAMTVGLVDVLIGHMAWRVGRVTSRSLIAAQANSNVNSFFHA